MAFWRRTALNPNHSKVENSTNQEQAAAPQWEWVQVPPSQYFGQEFWGADRHHNNHGIGWVEWFNFASGAALLLIGDGTWQTGGKFRLYWLRPGLTKPEEMTRFLRRNEYKEGSFDTWDRVMADAIEEVEAMICARSI